MKLVLLFLFLFFPLIGMHKDEDAQEIDESAFPTLLQLCVDNIAQLDLEMLRACHNNDLPTIPEDINPLLVHAIVTEATPFITKHIKLKKRHLETEIVGWPTSVHLVGPFLTLVGRSLVGPFAFRENIVASYDIFTQEEIASPPPDKSHKEVDYLFDVQKGQKTLVLLQKKSNKELLTIKPEKNWLFLYLDNEFIYTLELLQPFSNIMYYKLEPLINALEALKKITDYKQALLFKAICHAKEHQHFYDLQNSQNHQLYELFPEEVKDLVKRYLRTRKKNLSTKKLRCSLS